jgi:hypothetical protein
MERMAVVKRAQRARTDLKKIEFQNAQSSGYTKEEARRFRQLKEREKRDKKAEKKARREKRAEEERKVTTESGIVDDLVGHLPNLNMKDVASQFISHPKVRITRVLGGWLYQIWRSSSLMDYVVATHQLVEAFDVDIETLSEHTITFFSDKLTMLSEWRCTESGVVDTVTECYNSIMTSGVATILRDFVVSVAGLGMLPSWQYNYVKKCLGPIDRVPVVDFISSLLEQLRSLMRILGSIKEGVPITEALFTPDPMTASISILRDLIAYKDMTYSGLPTPGAKEYKMYMDSMNKNIKLLESGVKRMSPYSPVRASAEKVIREASMVYNTKLMESHGKTRTEPVALLISGEPGIGKSHIVIYVAKIWSAAKGRKFDVSHIFSKNPNANFYEGYFPFSNPIIRFSEVARSSDNMVKVRGDDELHELVSLVDTLPYTVDMAFGDKGKVYAFPELILADTNNEHLHAKLLYKCPQAYLRRLVVLKVSVLDQFRKDDSNRIDPVKSADAGGHILDRYHWQMYYNEIDNSGKIIPKMLLSTTSLQEFTDFALNFFREKIALGERLQGIMEDVDLCRNPDAKEWEEEKVPLVATESGVVKDSIERVAEYSKMLGKAVTTILFYYFMANFMAYVKSGNEKYPIHVSVHRALVFVLLFTFMSLNLFRLIILFCVCFFNGRYVFRKVAARAVHNWWEDQRSLMSARVVSTKIWLEHLLFNKEFNPYFKVDAYTLLIAGAIGTFLLASLFLARKGW